MAGVSQFTLFCLGSPYYIFSFKKFHAKVLSTFFTFYELFSSPIVIEYNPVLSDCNIFSIFIQFPSLGVVTLDLARKQLQSRLLQFWFVLRFFCMNCLVSERKKLNTDQKIWSSKTCSSYQRNEGYVRNLRSFYRILNFSDVFRFLPQ